MSQSLFLSTKYIAVNETKIPTHMKITWERERIKIYVVCIFCIMRYKWYVRWYMKKLTILSAFEMEAEQKLLFK